MDIASVGGPVATVIGAFGHDPSEARIYPPIHYASGNVFDYPDATAEIVDEHYGSAQYFLTVDYADGTREHMLIAQAAVEPSDMSFFQFSVNLDMDREPTDVSLYLADSPPPELDVDAATLIIPDTDRARRSPPRPVKMGSRPHGQWRGLPDGPLRARCELRESPNTDLLAASRYADSLPRPGGC